MYGQPKEKYNNDVRRKLLRLMIGDNKALTMRSNVDLSKLPPCKDNLVALESIIALHILSKQTNAAFGTPSQQIWNKDGKRPKNELEPNEYGLADLLSPLPWLP